MKELCFIIIGYSSTGTQFFQFCQEKKYKIVRLEDCNQELVKTMLPVYVYAHPDDDEYQVNQMFLRSQKHSGILVSLSSALQFQNKNNRLYYTIDDKEISARLPTENCYNAHDKNHDEKTFQALVDTIDANRVSSSSTCTICTVF